jgi:hypothetical protein
MFTGIGALMIVSEFRVPFTKRLRLPGMAPAVKVTELPLKVLREPRLPLVIAHVKVVPAGHAPPVHTGVAVKALVPFR